MFGLVWYTKFNFDSISVGADMQKELRAIQTVQKVQYLPEIQCTQSGEVDYNCIDMMKLDALKKMNEDGSSFIKVYETMFPRTKLQVVQLYPQGSSWTVYGHDIDADESIFRIPVSIHNVITDKYNFGYMEVTVYS